MIPQDQLEGQKPEVVAALDFLTSALDEKGLHHVEELEDGKVWYCAAVDERDHVNTGLLTWDEDTKSVSFVAHNALQENHDIAEGVRPEDSRCWWRCKDANMFLMHLTGEVRMVLDKKRKLDLAKAK